MGQKRNERNINSRIKPGVSADALNFYLFTTEEMARRNRGGKSIEEYLKQRAPRNHTGANSPPHPHLRSV